MRHPSDGAVAQLGERVVRNDEVRSSILLSSTNGGTPLTWLTRLGEIAAGFSPNGTAARVMENPGGLERKVREDEQELFIPGSATRQAASCNALSLTPPSPSLDSDWSVASSSASVFFKSSAASLIPSCSAHAISVP